MKQEGEDHSRPGAAPMPSLWWLGAPSAAVLFAGGFAGYRRGKRESMAYETAAPSSSSGEKYMMGRKALPFSPYTLAFRALAYGTALSVGGFSLGCGLLCYSIGVRDAEGFVRVMKAWVPQQLDHLGWKPSPAVREEQALFRKMDQKAEGEYWASFFREEKEESSGDNSLSTKQEERSVP